VLPTLGCSAVFLATCHCHELIVLSGGR